MARPRSSRRQARRRGRCAWSAGSRHAAPGPPPDRAHFGAAPSRAARDGAESERPRSARAPPLLSGSLLQQQDDRRIAGIRAEASSTQVADEADDIAGAEVHVPSNDNQAVRTHRAFRWPRLARPTGPTVSHHASSLPAHRHCPATSTTTCDRTSDPRLRNRRQPRTAESWDPARPGRDGCSRQHTQRRPPAGGVTMSQCPARAGRSLHYNPRHATRLPPLVPPVCDRRGAGGDGPPGSAGARRARVRDGRGPLRRRRGDGRGLLAPDPGGVHARSHPRST